MENILLKGCAAENSSICPVMIEPQKAEDLFIELSYQETPLDKVCDKRINLKSKSLKLVYNTITMKNLIRFFKPPIAHERNRLKAVAIKKIYQAKERSFVFMKNNLDKIPQTDMNIDIQPSYLLIPENSFFSE